MTIAAKIRKQLQAVRENNIDTWRKWAHDLAVDGTSPRPLDVLHVAAALGIADPGAALEADAQAIRELRSYEAAIDLCRTDRAAKLEPYGGDLEQLRAAVVAAEEQARRLREYIADIEWNGSEGFWQASAARLRMDNPRVFSEKT